MNYNQEKNSPIGIFDSGVGGLTVLRKIKEHLPNENLVYFGDTARVPYGSKSESTVKRYAEEDVRVLLKYHPKLIVVACNTVSALALHEARAAAGLEIPLIGVIEAGAKLASEKTQNGKIGVIGTEATVNSQAYPIEIHRVNKRIEVYSKACPLFVPLAEEGFEGHQATKLIAQDYLAELIEKKIDTLVLGCTHYPILKRPIAEVMRENLSQVEIIDSAEAIASEVQRLLTLKPLMREDSEGQSNLTFLVSDVPQKFSLIAERFLGVKAPQVEVVKIL
ncbi:MAG: glutamate racemase [Chloroherpetonaceae bacterium]|nr:glutamate racemase [Chloroherpetonaceae bacterium]